MRRFDHRLELGDLKRVGYQAADFAHGLTGRSSFVLVLLGHLVEVNLLLLFGDEALPFLFSVLFFYYRFLEALLPFHVVLHRFPDFFQEFGNRIGFFLLDRVYL
jgi:hypothetical protein